MSFRSSLKKMISSNLQPLCKLLLALYRNPWCDKIHSFSLSRKYKCIFLVGPYSNVVIEDGAKINIKGSFYFNQPWHGRQFFPGNLYVSSSGQLNVLGKFDVHSGGEIYVFENASLTFGSGYLNTRSEISCSSSIYIGFHAHISTEVIIMDSNFHTIEREGYKLKQSVIIGDHVWIGFRAMILPGVTIGNEAVIAACSLINKSVPSETLYGGVPAKCLRENVHWH